MTAISLIVTLNNQFTLPYHSKECMRRLHNIVMRDYQENVTTGQTHGQMDRQTPDKVIPMCRYTMQATQKWLCDLMQVWITLLKPV